MILDIADSVNGVPIRLTDERWDHIVDSHPELASYRETILDALENPDYSTQSARRVRGCGSSRTRGVPACLLHGEESKGRIYRLGPH